MTLALYGHPFSSYTWKALIALYANGTAFEFREIDPSVPKYESFTGKAHPSGQFPVLTDGDAVVVEASAIVEHLAVHHPGPAPLIPADPAEAVVGADARPGVRQLRDGQHAAGHARPTSSTRTTRPPAGCGTSRSRPRSRPARPGCGAPIAWLERWLADNTLPPHVSLVTCAAAPSLFYADWVEPIPADCPRLAALRAELLALPAVVRCVDDARPYRAYFPPGAPDRD